MCGITGYWARRGDASAWLKDLSASVASLKQRGPDDKDKTFDPDEIPF